MANTALRVVAAVVLTIGCAVGAFAQTNPTPFDLSTGNYSFTTWSTASGAGTYPPSIAFHTFAERIEGFGLTVDNAVANGDWLGAYNLTSGTRIQGQDAQGVSFTNTGSPATTSNCASVGAAVLAVNTTGRANVRVSWSSGFITGGSSPFRPYVLRLQYRIGTSGAWSNAIAPSGSIVEFRYDNQVAPPTYTLPLSTENQPVVQLRWIYGQDGSGSGTRPTLRLSNIAVTSTPVAGTPTALQLTSMIPASPSRNIPFTVIVRSVDGSGAPKPVATATTVTLSRNSGTGVLGGTLSAVIPAGASAVTFSNVTYGTAEGGVSLRATASGGDALSTVTGNTFSVAAGATYVAVEALENVAYAGTPMTSFRVVAYRPDGTIDPNYTSAITVVKVSGPGVVTGTATATPFQGVATFDNLVLSATGTVQLRIDAPGLASLTPALVTVNPTPSLGTEIVPQYVNSSGGTCGATAFAVPVFARITFNNLQPNTSYRYVTGMARDNNVTSTGPGLNLNYNMNDNTYSYSGGKNIANEADCSIFSTGAGETSKTIWVNMLISNNVVFVEGGTINWRVSLGDHTGRLVRHYQLSSTSTVLRLGTAANQATGLVDQYSGFREKNYVYLYDNEAGAGRPLAVAGVQALGPVANFVETYYRDIENDPTAWATMIPNTLPNGVRRIEERDARTGALVYAVTSPNGVWNGISTVNPAGGFSAPVIMQTPRIVVTSPVIADSFCTGETVAIRYNARGVGQVRIELSQNNGSTWEVLNTVSPNTSGSGANTFSWIIPSEIFNPNIRVRVVSVDRSDIIGVSERFTVSAPISVLQQPESKDLCLDDDYELVVLTSGAVRHYQWFKDGVALPGQNGPGLSITDAHYGSSGVYYCELSGYGNCPTVVTTGAHLRINTPTVIASQSRNVPVQLGGRAVLSVEVQAPATPSYQWYRDNVAIEDNDRIKGAKSSRLEIENVERADLGNDYVCVMTGVCGETRSRVVRVFTTGVYAELVQSTVDACLGAAATIEADLYANPATSAINVQWFRNGQPLSDGTQYTGTRTASLTINTVTASDAGTYTVVATLADDESLTASVDATVAIASTPTITTQPVATTVCEGDELVLNVAATATGTISYQWLRNGTVIDGASGAEYREANFTAARAGSYTVAVSTACGTATSVAAVVATSAATVITTQPAPSADVQVGTALTIAVVATGEGTLQYQWFKDGNELAGEVTPTYTKASAEASDAGRYWVRITSSCGDLFSDTTTVTTRPVVTSVEESTVAAGLRLVPNPASDHATLSVSAIGAAPMSVDVLDMTGQHVAHIANTMAVAGSNTVRMNVSTLPAGTYMVVVTLDGQRSVQMMTIVK